MAEVNLKTCKKCLLELNLSCFSRRKSSQDNLDYYCRNCKSKIDKQYRNNNLQKIKEQKQKYYLENKEKINLAIKENYYKNKEAKLKRIAKWKKDNKDKVNFSCAKRRSAKLNRNIYKDDEYNNFVLEEAYNLSLLRSLKTNVEHHVDHIVPLLGKTVSGLHVADNIQIIPAKINCSKKADYWPDMWN